MDDRDKLLGAPTMSSENPTPIAEKPKRKLNWKGFFIAIVAVIVIEFIAINLLKSGEPEIPIPPLQTNPLPTKAPTPSITPSG